MQPILKHSIAVRVQILFNVSEHDTLYLYPIYKELPPKTFTDNEINANFYLTHNILHV